MNAGRKVLAAFSVLGMMSLAKAGDEMPVPADAFVYCTVCHGVQMMGNEILQAPRLSGMASWYVSRQMVAFKNGERGIHEDDLDQVLVPFHQVEGHLNRSHDGTGLGLPLAKGFAELHGGTLEIDSTLGVGTTVTVRFPAERVQVEPQ